MDFLHFLFSNKSSRLYLYNLQSFTYKLVYSTFPLKLMLIIHAWHKQNTSYKTNFKAKIYTGFFPFRSIFEWRPETLPQIWRSYRDRYSQFELRWGHQILIRTMSWLILLTRSVLEMYSFPWFENAVLYTLFSTVHKTSIIHRIPINAHLKFIKFCL